MEKLPVFKTAWAANKYFFKAFFNVSNFIKYFLPLWLVSAYVQHVAFVKGLVEGHTKLTQMAESAASEQEAQEAYKIVHLFADWLEAESLVLPFFANPQFINVFYYGLASVGLLLLVRAAFLWHRSMLIEEELNFFKTNGGLGSFFKKTGKYALLMALLYAAIVVLALGLLFAIGALKDMGIDLKESVPAMIGVAVLALVFMYYAVKFFIKMSVMAIALPAKSIGEEIAFKDVEKMMEGNVVRFLLASTVAILIVAFTQGVLAGMRGALFLQGTDMTSVMTVAISFVYVWYMAVAVGVLTRTYDFVKDKHGNEIAVEASE